MNLPDSVKNDITAFVQPGASEGWMDAARAIEMAELVYKTQPHTVVDLGVFGGRSLIAQALALKAIGKGVVYGIDPWKTSDALEGENGPNRDWWGKNVDLHAIHKGCMEAVWRLGLDDYVIIIRAASQRIPRLFPGGIDIMSIDGNHSEAASCRDVQLYAPQLNYSGFAWFDDCAWTDGNGNRTTVKAQEMMKQWCDEVPCNGNGHYKLYWRRTDA